MAMMRMLPPANAPTASAENENFTKHRAG